MSSQPTAPPNDPGKVAAAIENGWKEAYRHIEMLRTDLPGTSFRVTEVIEEDYDVHHIVVVSESCGEAVIIRTELDGEFRTRFLNIPGAVVDAIRRQ